MNLIQIEAEKKGFSHVGWVDFASLLAPESAWHKHLNFFDKWLENENSGTMGYLKRGADRRRDPRLLFPAAKSAFVFLVPYSSEPLGHADSQDGPKYARYLRGHDYHISIKQNLEDLFQKLDPAIKYKICVDTSAVLERSFAYFSGLGWIGKNRLLIHPKQGSYFFIAVVLTNLEIKTQRPIQTDLCGNCSKCIDACPTQALDVVTGLDSKKCISYLTLENRDESIGATHGWVAGCDICQEVCPFNFKIEKQRSITSHQVDLEQGYQMSWDELSNETEDKYKARSKNSALTRVKPKQFKRNVEAALNRKP